MKNKFLLPNSFIKIGAIAIITGCALGVAYLFQFNLPVFDVIDQRGSSGFSSWFERKTYQGDVSLSILLIGLYFIGFSRKSIEDEFIDFLRYQSLLLALVIQTSVLIISSWLVGGLEYITVMMINLFSFLLIYNVTFMIMHLLNRSRSIK